MNAESPNEAEELEERIESFFSDVLPSVLAGVEGQVDRARAWRCALYETGLAGLDYPSEFGGQGLGPDAQAAWVRASNGRVPTEETVYGIGIGMALPVIRDHGSDALKQRFLAPGLKGEEIWCQLYSEPGAGSDLASLSTKAVRDGDEWIVTGQKVWTSGAQHSQMAILLSRTDPDLPKHRGITMFVLPMEQDGVTVRPLVQMTGHAEFNEVFMDEARMPAEWVVGEVNNGWRMAVALLAHERVQTGVASVANSGSERLWGRVPIPVPQMIELARQRGRLNDPLIRQDLARLWTNEKIIRLLGATGQTHPSIGKLWRTNHGWVATDLAARLAFPASPAWTEDDEDSAFFGFQILNCRGMSLGGGSDEIQRNTLAERVLGLPREPSDDKNTAFKDLKRSAN